MPPHRALPIVDVQRAFAPPPVFLRKLERYSGRFSCRIFTRYLNPAGSAFRRLLKQNAVRPAPATSSCCLRLGRAISFSISGRVTA